MRKFTLLLMFMFFVLGTSVANSQETSDFNLTQVYPSSSKVETIVYNIRMTFPKNITVTLPEAGIDVVNTATQDVIKITDCQVYDWEPNVAVFNFEQKVVPGKDGMDEMQPQYIETPGTYTYTIPAGCIKSVDGEEYAGDTFTFSIVATFDIVGHSPTNTDKLEKVELTFDEEILEVNMPEQGFMIFDMYYTNFWYTKSEAVISDDKKTVTVELVEPITTPGMYDISISQGVFVSANGINNYSTRTIVIEDLTPSFFLNIEDGERVQQVPAPLEINFKNVNEVKLVEGAGDIMVYIPGGGEVAGVATLADNKISVTFDAEFTEEGDYTFQIPEGFFTMDGVENEETVAYVTLYTFVITPLEIVSVTPVQGTVDKIEKVVVTFNQPVTLSNDENWQMISREITMSDGVNEYILTYNSSSNASNNIEYLANAEWSGYEYTSTPITADGRYVLNLADIVVDYAAEEYVDDWGYPAIKWHVKNFACEGTYVWTIDSSATGIEDVEVEDVEVEDVEQVIYDLTGRRVDNITNAGIYIVNGKKVLVK